MKKTNKITTFVAYVYIPQKKQLNMSLSVTCS